ncbi:MAG: ATP-binding protein [Myxococcota bacterium]
MLERLSLSGFKAYDDGSAIALRPFTVLIGANGAGKTTLMEAVDVLGRLVTGTIKDLLEAKSWEYGDLPHLRAATKAFSLEATLNFDDERLTWRLGLGARRRPGIAHESVVRARGDSFWRAEDVLLNRRGRKMSRRRADGTQEAIEQTLTSSWLATITKEDRRRFPELDRVATWARGIRGYFFLDPLKLRAPSRGDGTELGVNGEFLAPFLARLHDRDRPAFDRVVQRVAKHYPRLVQLHPVRRGYGWTHLEMTERWNGETARFNARQVSDGLLRLVAVAAMHELPTVPSVLLLDEVENGLHPHLLGGFVRMLQELVKARQGRTQVILATHSPITVNFCESADDVVLVSRVSGGHPLCRPLSSLKGYARLRSHFDLGELWYNLGEEALRR